MPMDDLVPLALEATAELVLPIVGDAIMRSHNASPHALPFKEKPMTQVAPDCARQLRRTKAQLARVLSWALQPDSLLVIRNVSASQWTPAEQIEHLSRVNFAILQGIRTMLEGPNPSTEPSPNEAAKTFLANGVIDRGRSAPPFSVPVGATLEEIRRDTRALVDGFGSLDPIAMANCRATFPNPGLGPLTAEQWLRFTEIHTFHHLQILCEIVGANL